jgi:glucuronate isomerase
MVQPLSVELAEPDAAALFARGLAGELSAAEAAVFSGHMLIEMARMSVQDGLVMTLHPGVYRNHSSDTFARFGPDTGHDIPLATSFVEGLRPLLERYGENPDFHLVLFTVDETTFSREIAPLAGFYPSVYIGAPWWFLDAPDAILRFRAAVTETAGFYRGAGFVDDTRAFLSIPARHDTSRRLDSAFLARLVCEGRLELEAAERIAVDLVDTLPRKVFKL